MTGGSTGVPTGATSVAVNLEVTNPTASGFLVGYTGSTIPSAVDGSVTSGVPSDTLLQIAPDANGNINIDFYSTASSGSLNLTIDIEGYNIGNQVAGTNGGFIALYIPQNIDLLHTKNSGEELADKVTNQDIGDQINNVPPEASSVLVDLAASGATTAGVLRAWPTGSPAPSSSQMHIIAGGGTSDAAIVPIGNNGKISLRADLASGTAQLTLTVLGYFTAAPAPPGAAFDPTPYLGNEGYWSYSRPISVGPQSSAKVNVSDGDLVVTATDSTPINGHGHLGYAIRRTYNSLDMAAYSSSGLLEGPASGIGAWGSQSATSIGEGWNLNLGDLGADLGGIDGAGLSSLLTPDWQTDTGQLTTLLPGNQIILQDQDGTRHVFTATNPLSGATGLLANYTTTLSLGALGNLLGVISNSTLSGVLGATVGGNPVKGSLCVDQQYAAPPGVHLALWRFVYIGAPGTGSAACTATTGSAVTAGYIAERPDGLRFVYASTGQLLDEIDRAGTDLRYVYGTASSLTSLASQIASGLPNLTLMGKLRSIYEAGVPGCAVTTSPFPAAPCRFVKLSYSTDGSGCSPDSPAPYAVCITDPAGRLTTYDLDANPDLASFTGSQAHLTRVTNPDGTFVGYQYGCNSAVANQLCAITDPNGHTTQIAYDSVDYPQAVNGPLVASISDRRSPSVAQSFSYTLGQLDAQQVVTARPGATRAFSAVAGLSSTTEVTTSQAAGTGTCTIASNAVCLVSQFTAIDTAGRVGEYDRGVTSGSAPCTGQPAGNVDGGGICAAQVILTNYDLNHVTPPAAPGLTPATTGGSLFAGTYYYEVTAVAGSGTTAVSPASEASVVMPSTVTGSVTLTFAAVTGATGYRVYRGTSSGTEKLVGDIPTSAVSGTPATVNWTDIGGLPTDPAPTTDTTRSLICEQDNLVNDNVCQTLQYGLNDDTTGVSNHIYTPNRQTTFTYGPDGSMVVSDISMPTGPHIQTTYGYRYQYFKADGSTPSGATGTIVNDNPAGSGTVTPSSALLPAPAPGGPTPSYLFLIADQTAMLSPLGNTKGGGFAAYQTTYRPDDDPSKAFPNTLQLSSGDPAGKTVCGTGTNAGTATADTGVNCETDAPAPSGAGTASQCQATAGFNCVTYTFNGWGEKTSMTTPLAHTSAAGSGEYNAYRYVYFPDSTKDVSGTTSAGGWLRAVADPLAGLTDTSTAAAIAAVTRHFVAYGYDAAGDTARTWDRLAIQNGAGATLGSFPGTEASATQPGFSTTLYGSKNSGSADLYVHPWRYIASSSTPLGETTTYGLDANGNDLTVKDPRGNTTTNGYDGDDELTSTTTPIGSTDGTVAGTTTFSYTSDGQVAVTTSPPLVSGGTGAITSTIYNPLDEPAIIIRSRATSTPTYPSGSTPPSGCGTNEFGADPGRYDCVTIVTYDGFGHPVSVLDPDGALTVHYYDAAGRDIGQTAQYGWTTAVPLLQKNFTNTSGQVANYLTTIRSLDANGNVTQTCTPRDFDAADGMIDNTATGSGTGNNLPTSTTSFTTLIADCATPEIPLYGSVTSHDPSNHLTQVVQYRAAQGTPDGTTVPGGTQTLTTTYQYDADGNPTSMLDPAGNAQTAPNTGFNPVTASYDLLDRRTSQAVPRTSTTHGSPTVVTTSWGYDDSGDVTSVTAPPGDATDSAAGHTTRITDSVYDLDHRLTKSIDAATSTNAASITTSDATNQQNLITTYLYDADGDLTQQFDPRATSGAPAHPSNYSIGITYDANDRPTALYTPRFDTSLGTPAGTVQTTQCPAGTAPAGFGFASTTGVCVRTASYDAVGNRTKVVLPTKTGSSNPREQDYTYTLDNLVATVSAPNPSNDAHLETVATNVYNGKGEPVSVADANGQVSQTTYTASGLPNFTSDNNGTTDPATVIYDANGGTLATAQQVNNTKSYLATAGITAAFQVTVTKSNSDGTVATSTAGTPDLTPPTTRYGYDLDGNPTTVTSPNNVVTTSSFTADGLLASTSQPVTASNTRTTVFSYDPAGRKESQHVTATTGADLGTQCFDYYPNDLPSETTARNTAASPCATATQSTVSDILNTYDAAGNQTDATDTANATTAAGRDVTATYYLDSLLAKTTATGGYSESLTYNGSGSVATRSTTVGSATQSISFTDDDAGLPISATSNQISSTKSFAFTYNTIGQLTKETMPTGDTLTNTYSATNETLSSSVLATSAAHNVATFSYGYDLIKRVTSQSRTGDTAAGGTSGPVDSTYSYAYDGAGRLCQFGDVTTGNATQIRDIATDADGNRLSYGNTADPTCLSTTAPNASATQTLAYNLDDSIKSGPTGGITGCANVSYTYNSAGELTSDGLNNYTYDGFGNTSADNESNLTLACITGLGITLSASVYIYDGFGRQVTNKATTLVGLVSNGTDTMNYDGLSSQLLTESVPAQTPFSRKVVPAADYLLNQDGTALAVGNDVASGASTGTGNGSVEQYVSDDGNGNVGTVTNLTGALACANRFDPYGNTEPGTGCTTATTTGYEGSLTYQTNRVDATGDYQDGMRTYEPTLGAFTSPDTYGPGDGSADLSVGIDPLTADTYNYVNGDPVNFDDPNGHELMAADGGGSCGRACRRAERQRVNTEYADYQRQVRRETFILPDCGCTLAQFRAEMQRENAADKAHASIFNLSNIGDDFKVGFEGAVNYGTGLVNGGTSALTFGHGTHIDAPFKGAGLGLSALLGKVIGNIATTILTGKALAAGAARAATAVRAVSAAARGGEDVGALSRVGQFIASRAGSLNLADDTGAITIGRDAGGAAEGGAAAKAAAFQGQGAYPGVDTWENVTLKAGTVVHAGEPGLTGFATSDAVASEVGNDAAALNQGLQIAPRAGAYRPGLTAFRLTENVQAARSVALANPQFGAGGFEQFFIPGFEDVTEPLVTRLMFGGAS